MAQTIGMAPRIDNAPAIRERTGGGADPKSQPAGKNYEQLNKRTNYTLRPLRSPKGW